MKTLSADDMRFTEIDGKRYEVGACGECPFRDMGDGGYAAHCTNPNAEPYMDDMLWIDEDGISIPDGCPLREVPEHKPCPFCGSIKLRMVYIDDTGEELEQWMMEEANEESEPAPARYQGRLDDAEEAIRFMAEMCAKSDQWECYVYSVSIVEEEGE